MQPVGLAAAMNTPSPSTKRKWVLPTIGITLAVLMAGAYAAINVFPAVGAQAADTMRDVIGDDAVAHLESAVYGVQDKLNQQQYALGLKKAQSPFAASTVPDLVRSPMAVVQANANLSSTHQTTSSGSNVQTSVTTDAASAWVPKDVPAFTKTDGEGQWQPYIQDGHGRTVAYRTYLNPDPKRPYASVGIVAFDLSAAQLNFVLGSQEPKSNVKINRPGTIPVADAQANKLLAVFNGGWKVQHGHYGVMVNGVTVVPPKFGMMTVALSKNGDVRMGVWGQDVLTDSNTLMWRQNNVPLIHDGQVNPLTINMSIADWGSALNGNVAVWRSALGLSKDGKTLYYAAGDNLLVSAMAQALSSAGAYQAMQLDVNNYWVHFDAVRADGDKLKPDALFPAMVKQNDDRYLKAFTRDFFYVTARAV